MNDFDRLKMNLLKMAIPFTMPAENIMKIALPSPPRDMLIAYSPEKDVVVWSNISSKFHGIGIADSFQELLAKVISFYELG